MGLGCGALIAGLFGMNVYALPIPQFYHKYR